MKLPLQMKHEGESYNLRIYAKEDHPGLFKLLQGAYEEGFISLHGFFPLASKLEVICRVIPVDPLPENYSVALADATPGARDHILILYGKPDQWEAAALRDTGSEIHEIGHMFMDPKSYIPWFEEGLCEHLEYLYQVKILLQSEEAADREWASIKNDQALRESIWKFQPWDEIQTINNTMMLMKKQRAAQEDIAAYYKSSWTAFDLRYRYSWGVIKGMVEHYGREKFAEILERYRAGSIRADELQRLAVQCLEQGNEGR